MCSTFYILCRYLYATFATIRILAAIFIIKPSVWSVFKQNYLPMQCNSIFRKGAFFIVIPMLLLSACSKSNNGLSNPDDNGGYASDASRIEWANNDVISIADAAGETYNGAYMRTTHTTIGECALVGTDTNTSAMHNLTIRFGDVDCPCLDGRKRRGTIIVYYNGNYTDSAQIHTITFDNYFINDNQLTGSITYTRVDTTVIGDWYYKILVNDAMNLTPGQLNSQIITWNGNLERKWVTGYATDDRSDDIYAISGSATLTRANGHQFTFDIATPLQFALNCDYAESGVADVWGPIAPMRILNYGSGNCDPDAQVSISGNVYSILLQK